MKRKKFLFLCVEVGLLFRCIGVKMGVRWVKRRAWCVCFDVVDCEVGFGVRRRDNYLLIRSFLILEEVAVFLGVYFAVSCRELF